jgi:hypothetical protein
VELILPDSSNNNTISYSAFSHNNASIGVSVGVGVMVLVGVLVGVKVFVGVTVGV